MARHDTTQKQRDSLGLGDAKAEQTLGLGQVVQILSGVHRPVHSTNGNSMTKGFPMPLPEFPWVHCALSNLSKMCGDPVIHHERFNKALPRSWSLRKWESVEIVAGDCALIPSPINPAEILFDKYHADCKSRTKTVQGGSYGNECRSMFCFFWKQRPPYSQVAVWHARQARPLLNGSNAVVARIIW